MGFGQCYYVGLVLGKVCFEFFEAGLSEAARVVLDDSDPLLFFLACFFYFRLGVGLWGAALAGGGDVDDL